MSYNVTSLAAAPAVAAPTAGLVPVVDIPLPADFPMLLDEARLQKVKDDLAAVSVLAIPMASISTLGQEAEQALHKRLDEFLATIDKVSSPQMFVLLDKLSDTISAENLPEVASRILDAKPSIGARLMGLVNRKALRAAADKAYVEACRLAQGKTKTISDVVNQMERDLAQEHQKLVKMLMQLDTLKDSYRTSYLEFGAATAMLYGLLAKGKSEVAALAAEPHDPNALADAENKLIALESRVLAVEATLTKLPADQIMLREIQQAGFSTMQEISTTASGRFANIKRTLIKIHAARMTRDVQRLDQRGAELDANLATVGRNLSREIITQAAHAPGDNRLAQANQVKALVEEAASLKQLVNEAKALNQTKFAQARTVLADARECMRVLES